MQRDAYEDSPRAGQQWRVNVDTRALERESGAGGRRPGGGCGIGQRSAIFEAHIFDNAGEPLTVGRDPAVVFDDDIDIVLRAEFAQAAESINGELVLLLGIAG